MANGSLMHVYVQCCRDVEAEVFSSAADLFMLFLLTAFAACKAGRVSSVAVHFFSCFNGYGNSCQYFHANNGTLMGFKLLEEVTRSM